MKRSSDHGVGMVNPYNLKSKTNFNKIKKKQDLTKKKQKCFFQQSLNSFTKKKTKFNNNYTKSANKKSCINISAKYFIF